MRSRLHLADLLILISTLGLLCVAGVSWSALKAPWVDLGALLGVLGLALAGVFWGSSGRAVHDQLVRLPGFFLWLYLYHRQAGVLIDELGFTTHERALSAADHWLFGGDLSVLLQAVYSPGLTEFVQWAYSLYYVILLGLPIGLLVTRRVRAVKEVLGTVALAHTILVAGNMLMPARWPVLLFQVPALADLIVYPFPMEGLWGTEWLRSSIAGGTRMLWDSMPSGHTCVTILMVLMTRRMMPGLLWLLVPVAVPLVFGTVYLRYHYGVDILAGGALALVLNVLAPRLHAWWGATANVDGAGLRALGRTHS